MAVVPDEILEEKEEQKTRKHRHAYEIFGDLHQVAHGLGCDAAAADAGVPAAADAGVPAALMLLLPLRFTHVTPF